MSELKQPAWGIAHLEWTSKSLMACLLTQAVAPLVGFLFFVWVVSPMSSTDSSLSILFRSAVGLPRIIAAAPEPFGLALLSMLIVACYTRSKRALYTWNAIIAVLNGLATGLIAVGRSM